MIIVRLIIVAAITYGMITFYQAIPSYVPVEVQIVNHIIQYQNHTRTHDAWLSVCDSNMTCGEIMVKEDWPTSKWDLEQYLHVMYPLNSTIQLYQTLHAPGIFKLRQPNKLDILPELVIGWVCATMMALCIPLDPRE